MQQKVCLHERMRSMREHLPAMIKQHLRFLHLLGLAAYFGSLLAVAVLTRSAGDWHHLALVRADAFKILLTAATPGMVLTMASGGGLMWKRVGLLKWGVMQAKLAMVMLMMINTAAMIMPTAAKLAELAREAAGSQAAADAYQVLIGRENLFGSINLVLFILVLLLSVRLTSPARPKSRFN